MKKLIALYSSQFYASRFKNGQRSYWVDNFGYTYNHRSRSVCNGAAFSHAGFIYACRISR